MYVVQIMPSQALFGTCHGHGCTSRLRPTKLSSRPYQTFVLNFSVLYGLSPTGNGLNPSGLLIPFGGFTVRTVSLDLP